MTRIATGCAGRRPVSRWSISDVPSRGGKPPRRRRGEWRSHRRLHAVAADRDRVRLESRAGLRRLDENIVPLGHQGLRAGPEGNDRSGRRHQHVLLATFVSDGKMRDAALRLRCDVAAEVETAETLPFVMLLLVCAPP